MATVSVPYSGQSLEKNKRDNGSYDDDEMPTAPPISYENYVFYVDKISQNDYFATGVNSEAETAENIAIDKAAALAAHRYLMEIRDLEARPFVPPVNIPDDVKPFSKYLLQPAVRMRALDLAESRPIFMWTMTFIHTCTLIGSAVFNQLLLGTPIQINPLNVMIGPSPGVLIQMGARFSPCMMPLLNGSIFECRQTYGLTGAYLNGSYCMIDQVCGLTGGQNQWYRFILPIFLHAGVLHYLFNMSFQTRTGVDLEKDIGSIRIMLIYFFSGIGGNILGVNLGSISAYSVGCSGSLYGLIGCMLLELIQNWSIMTNPIIELIRMIMTICVSLSIGLLPGVDNYAHVGGMLSGILLGLMLMPSVSFGKWDDRRKRIIAVLAFPTILGLFTLGLWLFYNGVNTAQYCPWCQYVNCIPGLPWCSLKLNAPNPATTSIFQPINCSAVSSSYKPYIFSVLGNGSCIGTNQAGAFQCIKPGPGFSNMSDITLLNTFFTTACTEGCTG